MLDRALFVGVVHEVHITLQDLRIELERILDRHTILGIIFIAHHVHESRVIYAVHSQCSDEITFHQPESLGKKQRFGYFSGYPIHDLPPELVGNFRIKLLFGESMLGPGRDGTARARFWKP